MVEQGTEEWFLARLGKVTASRVSDVMARTKSGYGAARKNYMMQLLCERLTWSREDGFVSPAMQRGIDLESLARAAYEVSTGDIVDQESFVLHPIIDGLGASPDGLVGDLGLIEIKCPNTAQHVACIQSGKPDKKYIWQMQTQMACTGREWCDFVSFDDRMPDELQLLVSRVERDSKAISELEEACSVFIGELELLETEMLHKINQA